MVSPAELTEKVPLIKSPAFWVPKPVQLPPDIHPLPDDVHAYFVYPHSLESHALSTLGQSLDSLRSAHSARLHLLESYAASKERAREAILNKLAPGWSKNAGVMEPSRPAPAKTVQPTGVPPSVEAKEQGERLLIGSDVGVGSRAAAADGGDVFAGIDALDSPGGRTLL